MSNLDDIGPDNVMIEVDYPHSDSTWPNSLDIARQQVRGLDVDTAYKVLRGNAERLFRFTPTDLPFGENTFQKAVIAAD